MSLQVAVVGLGSMGRRHSVAYYQMDGTSLTAGIDLDESVRRGFERDFQVPAYESLSDAIDDLPIDAVSIATPHMAHFGQSMTAIKSGIPVFVEKPMTVKSDEAQRLVEAATERGVQLGVGYQRRYFPPARELKQVLSDGEIGVPRMVNCYLGQDWLSGNADSWRSEPELSGGGLLYDTGSHLLEEILWLLEGIPTRVAAVVADRGQSVDVNSALSLHVSTGNQNVTVSIGICAESTDISSDEVITMWGSQGRLSYQSDHRIGEPTSLRVTRDGRPSYQTAFEDTRSVDVTKSKLKDFVVSVAKGTQPSVSGGVGVVLAELRTAIEESWRDGTTVDVGARIDDRELSSNPFKK